MVAEKQLAELARATQVSGSSSDGLAADAFLAHINALCSDLHVPTKLAQVGVRADQLDDLVRGSRGNSMNGNPRQLDDAELRALLEMWL
jgi:alcohol dehydrogenase class IV